MSDHDAITIPIQWYIIYQSSLWPEYPDMETLANRSSHFRHWTLAGTILGTISPKEKIY